MESNTGYILRALNDEVVSCLAQIVSKSSTVPDAVNAEHIAINKDHIYMNKFASANDEDFQMISSHLCIMVGAAKRRIDANRGRYRGLTNHVVVIL
jgi:hypothetical protein